MTASEVFYLQVAPKKHTGETVTLILTLILLGVLLAVLLGHPKPPPHSPDLPPAHAASLSFPR